MRVSKNHAIQLKNGGFYFIDELLENKSKCLYEDCLVDGIICNIYIQKLENNKYLFLVSNEKAHKLGAIYRHCWSIEVCFQSFKTRGFNLEDTHLKSGKKINETISFCQYFPCFMFKSWNFLT